MKKIITLVICVVLALSLVGCGTAPAPGSSGPSKPEPVVNAPIVNNGDDSKEPTLTEIVDITLRDGLYTEDALEKFFKDETYTYYFPSIKSEYVVCTLSNGITISIKEALESEIAVISDLDTYNIQYWIVDKDGNYTNSLDK